MRRLSDDNLRRDATRRSSPCRAQEYIDAISDAYFAAMLRRLSFDVGVSSLKLVAIHEQVEQRWPGTIDVTDIFDHPSIAELARLIESRREGSAKSHG